MSHPSDVAPALIVLGGEISVLGQSGISKVQVEDFFNGPRSVQETILKENEMITSIHVPEPAVNSRSLFLKSRVRNNWDFALSSVAISVRESSGVWDDVRIALGGVAVMPFRAKESENMLRGNKISEKLVSSAADVALAKAVPLKMNTYKVKLTKSLIKKVLRALSKIEQS